MNTITIEVASSTHYPIHLGSEILAALQSHLQEKYHRSRIVLISDQNVMRLHGDRILSLLQEFDLHTITITPGEKSKNRDRKRQIEDEMMEHQLGRDTLILAYGGGVVGDLSGFVAATYNRGIPWIQIPTTLLAMVDASVGGKTGVNTHWGKNLIGAIWQPQAVFIDAQFITELPRIELLNGMAEVIKTALILDRDFFRFLKQQRQAILDKEETIILEIIRNCVKAKRSVVQNDEREGGFRQILNFGHTVGHSLEQASGFGTKHGYCVATGIHAECQMAQALGILSSDDAAQITELLQAFDYALTIPKKYDIHDLLARMRSDKKALQQIPRFVLLESIGRVKKRGNQYSFPVPETIVRSVLERMQNDAD